MIRNVVIAMALSMGAFTLATNAYAGDPAPKKEEMKCDKDGKSCKDGENCKTENCKAPEKK
jgi:hypothetical protein